jgi:hypothetical protein
MLPGDALQLLRPNGDPLPVLWSMDASSGKLTVNVSSSDLADGKFGWAFEAEYLVN